MPPLAPNSPYNSLPAKSNWRSRPVPINHLATPLVPPFSERSWRRFSVPLAQSPLLFSSAQASTTRLTVSAPSCTYTSPTRRQGPAYDEGTALARCNAFVYRLVPSSPLFKGPRVVVRRPPTVRCRSYPS